MTLITPAGKRDFDWSPKEKDMVKTAATGDKAQKTDKDILFEAAQKVVKAQMIMDDDTSLDSPVGDSPVGDSPCADIKDSPCGNVDSKAIPPPSTEEAAAIKPAEAKGDAVQAVQELADKAQKAEEVAGKVQEAVGKVEQAVQEVKDAVGVAAEGLENAGDKSPDEVVLEVEVEDEKDPEHEEKETKDEEAKERETGIEDEDKKEDEIVQESCQAAQKKIEMKTSSSDPDDLVKTSKISPTTRKKVLTYYRDYLGYDPEYCKLLVTDSEK